MDIERFVEEEAAWLAKQEAGVRKELLSLYAETSAEMNQALRANARDSYSRRHIRATQAQLDVLIQEMGDRQVDVLGKSVQLTFERQLFREKDAWQQLEQAFGSPRAAEQFAGIKPIVPQRAVKALLTASTVSIKGFTDDMERDTRRVVGRSMLAGEGMAKTVKRLRQVKDIPKQPARLHLIGRMETARASNAGKQEFVDQVNEEFPELELWLMIKGRVDKTAETRNHWLTWAINGTVRNVTAGEYFEVHHTQMAEARAEYTATTRKKAYFHGIIWKRFELGLRSQSLPSHFNDRDVLVAWRPSWGEMAGPVKHPQGKIDGVKDMPQALRGSSFQQLDPDELVTDSFSQIFGDDDDLKKIFKDMQKRDSPWIPKPKQGLHPFENDLVNITNREVGRLFDEKGTVKLESTGPSNVQFYYDQLYDHRFHRMTHNHFNGTSFSHADIILTLLSNLREVRVISTVSNRKYLFSLARKGGRVWKSDTLKQGERGAKWKWSYEDLENVYNAYIGAYNEKLIELDAAVGFNRDQRAILATDYASSVVANQLNATYIRIPLP